jgi:excinuclease ABC subunit A
VGQGEVALLSPDDRGAGKHYGFNKSARWRDLPETAKQVLLYGSDGEEIRFRYDEGGRVYEIARPSRG